METIPRTMKAARLTAFREPLEIHEIPTPQPQGDEALVRVAAVGVCRSDWHQWNRDMAWLGGNPELPITPGHEIGGVVAAVGPDVATIAVGQRVTVPFIQSCGQCDNCRAGRDNLCLKMAYTGFSRDGGFAQYVLVRVADLNCVPLPDAVTDEAAAALGCRFTTGYHAVANRAQAQPGEWIAIFGAGGVGLSAIQTAAAIGARAIAIDIDPAKLLLAERAGAVATVLNDGSEPLPKRLREITGGALTKSLDCIASSKATLAGILSLRPGGRHVQVGLTSQEDKGQIALPVDLMVNREIEFVGSSSPSHRAYGEIFALMASGKLDPSALITRRLGLGEITEVYRSFDDFRSQGLSVVTSL